MPSRSEHVFVCVRIVDFFLSAISLAIAGLNSVIAHFAIVIRDRARSDLTNTIDAVLDRTFISTMEDVITNSVVAALASVVFAIFGALITLQPSWLRKHSRGLGLGVAQFILAIGIIITSGVIADDVRGFQTSFNKFGGDENIPYYNIMYYGGVGQAAYGCLLILLAVTLWLLFVCLSITKRGETGYI